MKQKLAKTDLDLKSRYARVDRQIQR